MQDPSQRVWSDGQDGFTDVIVVAGIPVVTDAPGIPDVPVVTDTAGVCTGAGDTGGWDVSVHAETRISAKSNPTKMTGSVLFFIIDDILIEKIMRDTYLF
ncbi:MAG: hypothetical protein WCX22_00225 [Methanoregula sp.]